MRCTLVGKGISTTYEANKQANDERVGLNRGVGVLLTYRII